MNFWEKLLDVRLYGTLLLFVFCRFVVSKDFINEDFAFVAMISHEETAAEE